MKVRKAKERFIKRTPSPGREFTNYKPLPIALAYNNLVSRQHKSPRIARPANSLLVKPKQLNCISPDEVPLLQRCHRQGLDPLLPLIHHHERVVHRVQNVIRPNLASVKV